MKGLKFKCSNNKFRGSKFKRKMWAKNKQKIEANARYGYNDSDDNDEAEAKINQNLIHTTQLIDRVSMGKFLHFSSFK